MNMRKDRSCNWTASLPFRYQTEIVDHVASEPNILMLLWYMKYFRISFEIMSEYLGFFSRKSEYLLTETMYTRLSNGEMTDLHSDNDNEN